MAKSLADYADWLDERDDLIWPKLISGESPKATPYVKPMTGIRLVAWNLYGTLLRISDGELLFDHPQKLRMQIALEKTVDEFKMWPSMYRKPGAPWEYLYEQYAKMLERRRLSGTQRKGDLPEILAPEIWAQLIAQLEQKEYAWDTSFYGDTAAYAEKIAYFFHTSLQAVAGTPQAQSILSSLHAANFRQALLADGQSFSIVQMLRALKPFGTLPPFGDLFDSRLSVISFQAGIRKPSPSLFRQFLDQSGEMGLEPRQILYVSSYHKDDLAVAKQLGLRTALYAGDKDSLRASKADVNDPEQRPDRLLTDLSQMKQILSLPG